MRRYHAKCSGLYTPVLNTNVNLFLYMALRSIGVVELQLHYFLTSGIDRDECLALHPGRLTPGKELRQPLNMRLGEPQPVGRRDAAVSVLPTAGI